MILCTSSNRITIVSCSQVNWAEHAHSGDILTSSACKKAWHLEPGLTTSTCAWLGCTISAATRPESTPFQSTRIHLNIAAVYRRIHCAQKNDNEPFRVLERKSGSVEIEWRVKRASRTFNQGQR